MDFNHRYSNHIKRSEVRGKGVMLTSTVATITGTVATFTGAITILIGTVATFTGKIDISIAQSYQNGNLESDYFTLRKWALNLKS